MININFTWHCTVNHSSVIERMSYSSSWFSDSSFKQTLLDSDTSFSSWLNLVLALRMLEGRFGCTVQYDIYNYQDSGLKCSKREKNNMYLVLSRAACALSSSVSWVFIVVFRRRIRMILDNTEPNSWYALSH